MDSFAEHMVKKHPDSRDTGMRFGIIAGAIILSVITVFLCFLTGIWLILIITIGIIYLAYYLFTNTNVEYEYAVTNGEMDVDKIIARRKRKSLISIDFRHCEAFGLYTEDVPDMENATLVLCSDNSGEGAYYADVNDDDLGQVRVVFTPDDKMIETIHTALPPQLKRKLGIA